MEILEKLPEGIVMPKGSAKVSTYSEIYTICKKMQVGNVCNISTLVNSKRTLKHNITNISSCIGKHFNALAESYAALELEEKQARELKVKKLVQGGATPEEAEKQVPQVEEYVKPTFTLFVPEGRQELWMGRVS